MSAESKITLVDFLDAGISQPEPWVLDISRLLSHSHFRAIILKAFSDDIKSVVSGPAVFYCGVGARAGRVLGRRAAKFDRRGFVSIRKREAFKGAGIISKRVNIRRGVRFEYALRLKNLKKAISEIRPDINQAGHVTAVVFDDKMLSGHVARHVAGLLQSEELKKAIGGIEIRVVFAFVAEQFRGRRYLMQHCAIPESNIISLIRYTRPKRGRELRVDRRFGAREGLAP